MHLLENDVLQVQFDEQWPRIISCTKLDNGATLSGCAPHLPFTLELNGLLFDKDDIQVRVKPYSESIDYTLRIRAMSLTLIFRFELLDNEIVWTIPEVKEVEEGFVLETLYVPNHRLLTGTARNGDSYLRHVTRRANWSRSWCPGTATYDQWEDFGRVGDGNPELGPQLSNHACIWNDGFCAVITSSTYVEPLVTELSADDRKYWGRAGRFSMWAGTYSYRLRGELAEPFEVRLAVLGDYNGNGTIDWCDAAAWEGDQWLRTDDRYHEAIVYKLMLDVPDEAEARYKFTDVLDIVRDIHDVSGGLKQIVYLVGWQHTGHDTGYPSHMEINPRLGTHEEFLRLIEEAKQFNCVVSIHGNYDDSYAEFPEYNEKLLSQEEHKDGDRRRFVWFRNLMLDTDVLSINHTRSVESGYSLDRTERLLKLLPLRETVHFDAHRPYNEVWEEDSDYISAECEVQHGLKAIKAQLAEHGIDITTEDTDDEKRGLYSWLWILPNWLHGYKTVMYHGRVGGKWRAGMPRGVLQPRVEGEALGLAFCRTEDRGEDKASITRHFYLHWMYAQLMQRKKLVAYRVGDWNNGVYASFEDETDARGDHRGLLTRYEGIEIARNTDRFLPWRENVIFSYSDNGGPQEWTLPATWEGQRVTARQLLDDETTFEDFNIQNRALRFKAPAGVPIRWTIND